MDLTQKIQSEVEAYNQLNQEQTQLEERLGQVKTAKEQIRGKVTAFQELQNEQIDVEAVEQEVQAPAEELPIIDVEATEEEK